MAHVNGLECRQTIEPWRRAKVELPGFVVGSESVHNDSWLQPLNRHTSPDSSAPTISSRAASRLGVRLRRADDPPLSAAVDRLA
jgi:hypothetical protein